MRKKFSIEEKEKEKLEKKIFSTINSTINKVEEGEREHLLDKEEIKRVIEVIANTPFGYAEGAGGTGEDNHMYFPYTKQIRPYSQVFTFFHCSWFTWRNKKYILLIVYRTNVVGMTHLLIRPKGKRIIINTECKRIPYENIFPERYSKYIYLKRLRAIRHLPEPPSKSITWLKKDEGGLVMAKFKYTPSYLWIGTPAGWFETRWKRNGRSAWLYLKDLGFPVPARKNKRIWNEEMEAYAIVYKI